MHHTSHDATATVQSPQAREAHRLADLGYRVFPCVAGKKIPAVEGGCLAATTDPDTISLWWTRWPSANVAIATTALLALDVDRLADGSANPWLTVDRLDALARGPMAQTPRGGRHFVFRAPDGANLRCTASTIAPRVDTRAAGGYIVVAPSTTEAGQYRWCAGYPLDCAPDDLPLPPQWLMDALGRHRQIPARRDSQPASTGDGTPIGEGRRNSTLASLAGAMRRKGCGQLEILAALRAANARCVPTLDDDEVSRIASSVSRYEPQADDDLAEYGIEADDAPRAAAKKPAPEIIPWQPFPVDCLPSSIGTFVSEHAAAMGCDPAFVALPLLAVLASCIGNSRRIVLKRSWSEPSVIWATTIAPPSSLKSPAWQAAVDPLHQIQLQRMQECERATIEYNKMLAWHEAALAEWKRSKTRSGDPPEEPKEPVCVRHITSDATVEALVSLLADQPRGLLYAVDELAGWLNALNCYKAGKGGDLQAFLSMHRAGPVTTDRKTGRRVARVPRAALSICGTIQPAIYQRLASTEFRDSGLLARILCAMPPVGRKRWTDDDIDDQTAQRLREIMEGLLDLGFDDSGENPEPIFLGMQRPAKDAWRDFYNEFAAEQADAEDYQAGCFGKIEGYCPRFALLMQMVRYVEGTAPGDAVDQQSMNSAIVLARWFAHESRRVLAMLRQSDDDHELHRLADLIRRRGGTITARELTQCDRRYRDRTEAAERALRDLESAGFGGSKMTPPGSQGGRPVSVFRLTPRELCLRNPSKSAENEGSVDVDNRHAQKSSPEADGDDGEGEWEF